MKSTHSVLKSARKQEQQAKFAAKTGASLKLHYRTGNQLLASLPIPSRDEILSSPVQEHGPHPGATSGYTANQNAHRPPSPIMDDPSEELERELAGTHLGGGMRG